MIWYRDWLFAGHDCQINKAGVNGYKLSIHYEDSACAPLPASQAAKRLIDQVKPDVIGTAFEAHLYPFVFQGRAGQIVPDTDHWTGAAVQEHPDFAWYPTARAQQNPGIDYKFVVIDHPISSASDERLADYARATIAQARTLLLSGA